MTPDAVTPHRDTSARAAIAEALSCLLGEGAQTTDGGRTWNTLDPLRTGLAVEMRQANTLLRSPAISAWVDAVEQAAIALTLAANTMEGRPDGTVG